MPSAGADASESDLDATLAGLSGPQLVARLRTTCRRADYEAAARVLADRDRRLAEAENEAAESGASVAQLRAEVDELRKGCLVSIAEKRQSRGPSSRSSSGGAIAAAKDPVPIIDLSSDDDDDDELEEGEFRPPGAAGVSCKRKEPASTGDEGRRAGVSCQRKESVAEGEERTPAGVSCKRKAPASECSPDDGIPLSQLSMKKKKKQRKRAQPVAKVAVLVQGTGNGQSGRNGGVSRTMPSPPPTGSTARNSSRKNGSKPGGSECQARIGEKQGPAISPC